MQSIKEVAKKNHRFRLGNLEYRMEKGSSLAAIFEVTPVLPTSGTDWQGQAVTHNDGYDTYKYIKSISVQEAREVYRTSKSSIVDLIVDSSFFMSQTWFTPESYSKACKRRDQEMWESGLASNE
jgi:hypothetical protein